MAVKYVWDSQQSMGDIITSLQDKTSHKKNEDPWTFRYKYRDGDIYNFSLVYDGYLRIGRGGWLNFSYKRSYLKGMITKTENGCRIIAGVRFRLENIWTYIMLCLMLYFAIRAISGTFYVAIILFLLSISLYAWYSYTYVRSKEENPHLEMVTFAAKTNYRSTY